ncbi:unnamed protein product [Caenorhabditis angaria]|uniref:C-type lectin domain-containing protein n=1 Tax=Caenorhabditis angaria TaxID=860376 RepID=A0A9P1IHP6_9PELO|nr:unnamed protein product [Caenorhabditis angaria]
MMRILIFVLVFLIHLQLVTSLSPQKACEGFLLDWWKYMSSRDLRILHANFKEHHENGWPTTKWTKKAIMEGKYSGWRKTYEEALANGDSFWEIFWGYNIAQFTVDGLLEWKNFENRKLSRRCFMIEDASMPGGYKVLKCTLYTV